ncbi:PilW family protein [Marinobacterium sedimentorum]|uniref:PilW family protein n=1 Tax=Marinobacterium sedimentorum TaxID=2927804 RepID=UPI0020C6E971|nr:prepilin-type N-terminal cleavage/methylation domain-containing protein [Marinobacterium sedimentorum]MCP8688494.1 prepilin-type N-terminal cleavage/methylation domain-containing protein [Marinobacterium sedimentorum]
MLVRQRGFSLIELMIAMLLGLLVSAIVIGMFSMTVGSTKQAVTTIRLNQELRTVMDLMVRDLRRAGYWNGALAASNPYASITDAGAPAAVYAAAGSATFLNTTTAGDSGQCVMLGYDTDSAGASTATKLIGYRLDTATDAVEVLWANSFATPAHCNMGSWDNLTDEQAIKVTSLTFTPGPNPASFAAATVRNLTITLTAESLSDSRIKTTITDQVRIRNDL